MQIKNDKGDYDDFRGFLQNACGILLGENKEYLVNSRLRFLIDKQGFNGLGGLVKALKGQASGGLKEEVVDAMTTNETLWFRDAHPFRILKDIIFRGAPSASSGSPLRVWSAACSTGQEPYSIAITAEEYKQQNPGKLNAGVKIVATDISTSVLSTAKSGVYEMLALGRGMSPERLNRHFQSVDNKRWTIKPQFRNMVDFRTLNLLENYGKLGGKFDVVFCRNVLIYFSSDLKKDILTRMHQVLNPGGYLILGASESLNGLSDKYEMVQCKPGIIYRAK